MEWREAGLLLTRKAHGESGLILNVLTETRGRHAGIVRGGASRKMSAVLQPGAQLDLTWRARLEDHLGAFTAEPLQSRAHLMADRVTLAGLGAMTGLLAFSLPERQAYPTLYANTISVLEMMDNAYWTAAYLRWELALLEELGYGLDLSACAVTGSADHLAFVSPKSGRAVSKEGAGEWADRLLPLSPALVGQSVKIDDTLAGLRVTGHFLENWLAPALGNKPLPEARARLVALIARRSDQS